ncbi:hypothetical protein IP88_15495, partial [alpha proteobacterium AAP81b]
MSAAARWGEMPDRIVAGLRRGWALLIGPVDHAAVLAAVHEEASWCPRYVLMVVLSAGIAVLGLLQSSPAVVIGAMLISPLMGPIIGLGFALAVFDWGEVRRSGLALAAGSALGIGFAALIVATSPLQAVTAEILARTRPTLFDLLVAVFSALAGGYATIAGRGGTIVGVAIATALMPPLATVGFGIATGNAAIAGGALALFFTNMIAIALTAALTARAAGFAAGLSPHQTRLQALAIAGVFVALAVPLALSLRQIAWESAISRDVGRAISASFGEGARISQLDMDFGADPVVARAVVLTPRITADAEAAVAARLADRRRVSVRIEQLLVGNDARANAELAEARAALARAEAARAREGEAAAIGEALAILAGAEHVAVDLPARHAVAMPRPPVSLARLRAREADLAARHPGWKIEIVPPTATPLRIPFAAGDGATPDAAALADV